MYRKFLLFFFASGFLMCYLLACNESERKAPEVEENYFANCVYSSPIAIFSLDVPGINTHRFELQARQTVEQVVFDNGLALTIYQRGCNEVEQYFEFIVSEKLSNMSDEYWIKQAGQYFQYIGALDEQYLPLYEWGELMTQYAPTAQLGTNFEPYPDFFIQVTTEQLEDHVLLHIRLATTAIKLE